MNHAVTERAEMIVNLRARVAELERKNAALRAEVERLQVDKARLDWLEVNKAGVYLAVHEEWQPTTMTTPTHAPVRVVDGWACSNGEFDPHETPRAAIDAAMERKTQP